MCRIREIEFAGWNALELVAGDVRMVLVTSVGPRIASYGFAGRENLLYWDDAGEHHRRGWRLYGGHRLWTTRPLADESEESYAPDNAPCTVEDLEDGVRLTAPANELAIEKSLAVRADSGRWTITHRLRNASDMLWSGGAWALTCTRPQPSTRYRIPLGGSRTGWDVATIVVPLRWGGTHSSRLDDQQFTFTEDALELRPKNDEAKRMVLAAHGLLEMRDERGVFCKTSPCDLHASYPLGANLAVYVAPAAAMVELETMSPQRTLWPGDTLEHVETWTLNGA